MSEVKYTGSQTRNEDTGSEKEELCTLGESFSHNVDGGNKLTKQTLALHLR